MLPGIFLAILTLAVGVLVAVDFSRTSDEGLHGHADGSPHDLRPRMVGDTGSGRTEALPREPVGVHDADPTRRPENIGSPAAGQQHSRTGQTVHKGPRRELRNWDVRSRLLLLVIIPAVAVTVVAVCAIRIADILRGAPGSSVGDRAIMSALVLGVVVIVVLALAFWATIVAASSVLQPLHRLQARAREVAGIRLPDAVRRISENNGEAVPSDLEPIDVDSSDEMGEIARAFDQMRREMLRLAANEDAFRSKLDSIFVNLSHRSQSLVERQIRLIENLEQGEQDRERLANLFRMDRIGHEPSSAWNQPVAIENVIRAAVSEVEEYERVSLNAQPDIAVRGPAVNDVTHLLAELIENATSFSAADMLVDISGYLLNGGGFLVDITDRGVGMAPKEMAYANWQLENPPAKDINVLKWMGLFVVARLAARHGIRVRLQQAEFGGLTALVWLPDEVITNQGAAPSPRLGRFDNVGTRPGLHAAVVDPGYATAEQRMSTARSTEFASSREDVGDAPLGRALTSDAGRRPSPTWSDSSLRLEFQAEPPATVRQSGSRLPGAMVEHAGVSGHEAQALGDEAVGNTAGETLRKGPLPGPGLSAQGQSETSQLAGTPVGNAATLSQETSSAESDVVVIPADGLAEARRLPIFEAVESHWFRGGRTVPGVSGVTAAAGSGWASPADQGWHAAETVDSPSSGGQTTAGLPKRLPNANLVPGAIPSVQPVAPKRSAAAARDRLAGLQRGVSQGRAAAGEAAGAGGEDES
jgi:signal transduction histidine kinase